MEDENDEPETIFIDWISNIYPEIAGEYSRYKNGFQCTRFDSLLIEFGYYEDSILSEEEYDKEFAKFKRKNDEDKYWTF